MNHNESKVIKVSFSFLQPYCRHLPSHVQNWYIKNWTRKPLPTAQSGPQLPTISWLSISETKLWPFKSCHFEECCTAKIAASIYAYVYIYTYYIHVHVYTQLNTHWMENAGNIATFYHNTIRCKIVCVHIQTWYKHKHIYIYTTWHSIT